MSTVAQTGPARARGFILPLLALALFIAVICFYSRVWWAHVLSGIVIDGSIAAIWLGAATLLGSIMIRRLRVSGLPGFCSAAGLGLGIFSLIILAMGLMGVLNRTTALVLLFISAAAGLIDLYFSPRTTAAPLEESSSAWSFLWLIAAPFAAIAIVGTNIMPAVLWKPIDPHPYDVMSYHLQVPREWYELGKIAPLRHNVYSFFPFAAEMNYLLAMHLRGGPWAGMYLAQMMSFIYMLLAVLSVAAAMPTRRAGMIAALAMSVVPWTVMLGSIAYNESALLLYESLAAVWVVRALRRQVAWIRSMLVAGAFAGFACGVKYTAVPLVLFAFPIAIIAAALLTRGHDLHLKPLLAGAVIFIFAGILAFSPWLIRNSIWTGNPVFPLAMRQLGQAHFNGEQVGRFERAHRAPQDQNSFGARLGAIRSEVFADERFGRILVPIALLAAVMNWRRPEAIFFAISVLFCALFWLKFTHLMGRFFVPAIPLLAMLLGLLATNPRGTFFSAIIVALLALGGWRTVRRAFDDSTRITDAYAVLFRLRDLNELWPAKLAGIENTSAKVALIGDAEAFRWPLPMSRLEYRTIFDVVVPPGKNIVDAWLGRDLKELQKDHYIILNPGELNRLSKTYYGIPPVPPQWQQQRDETIILSPTGP